MTEEDDRYYVDGKQVTYEEFHKQMALDFQADGQSAESSCQGSDGVWEHTRIAPETD